MNSELKTKIGFDKGQNFFDQSLQMVNNLNFKLKLLELPGFSGDILEKSDPKNPQETILNDYSEQLKLLANVPAPIELRIQKFISKNFPEVEWKNKHKFPKKVLNLDSH